MSILKTFIQEMLDHGFNLSVVYYDAFLSDELRVHHSRDPAEIWVAICCVDRCRVRVHQEGSNEWIGIIKVEDRQRNEPVIFDWHQSLQEYMPRTLKLIQETFN